MPHGLAGPRRSSRSGFTPPPPFPHTSEIFFLLFKTIFLTPEANSPDRDPPFSPPPLSGFFAACGPRGKTISASGACLSSRLFPPPQVPFPFAAGKSYAFRRGKGGMTRPRVSCYSSPPRNTFPSCFVKTFVSFLEIVPAREPPSSEPPFFVGTKFFS